MISNFSQYHSRQTHKQNIYMAQTIQLNLVLLPNNKQQHMTSS